MSENWQISSRVCSKAGSHAAKAKKAKSAGCGRAMLLLCAWLLGIGFGTEAQAQINVPSRVPPPPPQPQPLEIKVRRGATAQITLRVYGSTGQEVRFRLKTKPALGTLSDPQPAGQGAAVVTYEHSGKPAPVRDHFSYIAQSGAGVSAPADVSITIVDDPPILAAPAEMDFGMAQPGESVEHELMLENRGGGMLEGRLEPPPGWKVTGEPVYRLDRGERQKWTLVFTPDAERVYRGELRYTGSPDRVTLLRGEGAEAFALRPPKLELAGKSDSTVRSGVITVENRTKQARFAHLEAGPRLLIAQDRIEVPANGKIPITVEAAADDPSPFTDKLTAEIAGINVSAEVQVPAIGPVVRTNASKVSFGAVDIGAVGAASLQVENLGGTSAQVRIAARPPFSVARGDESFVLDARSKRSVRVLFHPSLTGKTASTLSVQTAVRELKIPLEAEGTMRLAANTGGGFGVPASPSAAGVAQLPPWRGDLLTATPLQASGANQPSSPGMRFVRVSWKYVSSREAEFQWAARGAEGGQRDLRVEVRRLSLDENRELKIEWLPVRNADIRQAAGVMTVRLKKLTPNTLYTYRLVPVSASGEPAGDPLGFFELHTPPVHRTTARSWILLGLLVVLGVLLWLRFAPRRRSRR